MQVMYFGVDGYEGQFFLCPRYGTMSPAACAKNFTVAPELHRTSGRLEGCIGCAVGQGHADPVAACKPLAPKTAFVYRQICVRCRRGGEADDNRLMGRMRLVRDHTICVSCYNREAEVLKGKNAKGARPKKWSRLLPGIQISSVADGSLTIEQFDHPVRDRLEAILTLLRRKSGPKVVAWTASSIVRAEASL